MKKKIIFKSFITLVAIILSVTAYTGAIDESGLNYTEKSLSRALIVFGIARGINGVISVAQGTELSFQPMGVGVNFTPGEILDPINDLVERFSLVMLISSTSIGLQKILLEMCRWQFFTYIYIFLQLLFILFIWIKNNKISKLHHILSRIILIMIFIRFSIPIFAISNEFIFNHFLSRQFDQSTVALQETTDTIRDINEKTQNEVIENDSKPSITEQVKSMYNKTVANIDFKDKIEKLRETASNATKYTINLIVVFIFQTILLPLIYFLLFYAVLRWGLNHIPPDS